MSIRIMLMSAFRFLKFKKKKTNKDVRLPRLESLTSAELAIKAFLWHKDIEGDKKMEGILKEALEDIRQQCRYQVYGQ